MGDVINGCFGKSARLLWENPSEDGVLSGTFVVDEKLRRKWESVGLYWEDIGNLVSGIIHQHEMIKKDPSVYDEVAIKNIRKRLSQMTPLEIYEELIARTFEPPGDDFIILNFAVIEEFVKRKLIKI